MTCDTTWHLHGNNSAGVMVLVRCWWNLEFLFMSTQVQLQFMLTENSTPEIRRFPIVSCNISKRWFVGNNALLVCFSDSNYSKKSQERDPQASVITLVKGQCSLSHAWRERNILQCRWVGNLHYLFQGKKMICCKNSRKWVV